MWQSQVDREPDRAQSPSFIPPLFLPTASSGTAALPLLQGSWVPKGPCHGWGNLREPLSSLSFPPCFLGVSQFPELLRTWEETNGLHIWDLGTWLLLTGNQPCHCPWGLPAWLAFWIFLLHSLSLALLDVLFKILENQTHAYICFFLRNQKTIYKGKCQAAARHISQGSFA
jgi:hypothetical protein